MLDKNGQKKIVGQVESDCVAQFMLSFAINLIIVQNIFFSCCADYGLLGNDKFALSGASFLRKKKCLLINCCVN